MVVKVGEKLHVITRRLLESEVRRHFVGQVTETEGGLVRLEGYVFVHDEATNEYVRRPEKRIRIIGIGDAAYIVKVIPGQVSLEDLAYRIGPDGHLVVTDGSEFSLDINEFNARR